MGSAPSKVEQEDTVRRCKERRRNTMGAVAARQQLFYVNADYLRSLASWPPRSPTSRTNSHFALKNSFYETEMPIRCELFDFNLAQVIQKDRVVLLGRPARADLYERPVECIVNSTLRTHAKAGAMATRCYDSHSRLHGFENASSVTGESGRREAPYEQNVAVPEAAREDKRQEGNGEPHEMGNTSSATTAAPVSEEKTEQAPAPDTKPKKKICCACPDTKKLRDECIVQNGEDACGKLIEAHLQCLRAEGFKV